MLAPDETQRAIARRTFLRLIQFGEGRSDTRRQQPVEALRAAGDDPAAFDATLAALAANRLVTLGDSGTGARTVDLAHEALIRGWPLLGEWIKRWRAAEQTRQRLEEKAAERERLRAQGAGGLLDAVELAEAEDWLASPDAAELGRSAALVRLAHESRAALDAAAREKEARLAELAMANAGLRRRALVAGVVGVLAVLAAVIAWWQWDEARQQTTVAVTAQEVAEAEANDCATAQAVAVVEANARATEVVIRSTAEALAEQEAAAAVEARATAEAERAIAEAAQATAEARRIEAEAERQRAEERNLAAQREAARAGAELLASKAQELMNDNVVSDRPLLLARDAVLATRNLPNGFVTASADAALRRAVAQSAWRMTLQGHTGWVTSAAYSSDGTHIVSAGDVGTLRVWDGFSGEEARRLVGHAGLVTSAAYSPDGTHIVSAGVDGTVRVWNAASGEEVRTLAGHAVSVRSVAYSPDGTRIVSAGDDGPVRVWDAVSGEEVRTLAGHAGWVLSAAYSPDGTRIVSAGGGRRHAARMERHQRPESAHASAARGSG